MSQNSERQSARQKSSAPEPLQSLPTEKRDGILFEQALTFNSSFCVFLYHFDVDHSRQVWRGQWERCSYDTLYTGTHARTGTHTAHRPRRQDAFSLCTLLRAETGRRNKRRRTGSPSTNTQHFTAKRKEPPVIWFPLRAAEHYTHQWSLTRDYI